MTPVLQKRIEQYQHGPFAKKWEGCKAFKDHQSMLQSAAKPDGVIVGVPPAVHGETQQLHRSRYDVSSAELCTPLSSVAQHTSLCRVP